ncbi:MAG: DUF3237 domain-containing protein [Acidimicrobiales bacterium]
MNIRTPPQATLTFVARFEVDLAPPVEVGDALLGHRRVVPIVGGRFHGPRLNGVVEPGGADWQRVTAGGTAIIDTRYLLRTEDGVPIIIYTEGFRRGPPEVLARLQRGDEVSPDEYYFRVLITFDTGDERYSWLRDSIFVGLALRAANAVVYDAFMLD